VDWLSAAALIVRPEAIRGIGGFDPRYFLYGEDVDLGERLLAAGWELWTVPDAQAEHLVGGSQGRTATRWVDMGYQTYTAREHPARVAVFNGVLAIGLTVRALVWKVFDRSPDGRIRAETVLLSSKRAWRAVFMSVSRLRRSGTGSPETAAGTGPQ
jgi:N-acetylglucosaminyl-diphospho-decaprenol L-rhamnosyltransferase